MAVQAIVDKMAQLTKLKEEVNALIEKLEKEKEECAEQLNQQTGKRIKNEMEIGMRNKRVYTHISMDADINRKDLVKLIKNAYF